VAEDTTNTESPLLYALAMVARRVTESVRVGQPINIIVEIPASAHAVLARSFDEAKQIGLAIALHDWPESEGWLDHSVVASYMDRQFLVDTLIEMDEASSTQDWPDLVM
jgi:hypothetical protein